jgi:predicted GNAT superfamily acetyltransferase
MEGFHLTDLREAPALHAAALALNAVHEAETGPLDAAAFAALLPQALAAPAATGADGALLGFAVALPPGARYASPNYLWVAARFPVFAYVDRVIAAPAARGRGVARALYGAVTEAARGARLGRIACEVNLDPPNPVSDAFHAALGFAEIGRARLPSGKTVRYLARAIA